MRTAIFYQNKRLETKNVHMKKHYLFLLPALATLLYTENGQCQKKEYKPEDTEVWSPEPAVVTPGRESHLPPSDAIILFDGSNADAWKHTKSDTVKWLISDGAITVVPKTGQLVTRQSFGSCQLHIEFKMPVEDDKTGQGRGNSGVFFMGRYEVQVLNNYNNKTYVNGQCASVYKDSPPLVNACRPSQEWQCYDIVFTAPVFNKKGKLVTPAYVTVFHNGVLVQNHTEIKGTTAYIGPHSYTAHAEKEPLGLQDHGNAISFRNIWLREL